MQRYLSFPFFWLLKTRKKASSRLSKEVLKAVSDHLFRRAQEEALSASFRVTREYERRVEGEKSYRKPEYHQKCLAEESVGPRSLAPIRGGSSQGECTVSFATSSRQRFGVLRVGCRLDSDPNMCQLVILPKKHHLTEVIICHVHQVELQHIGGANRTFSQLSTKYWIIGGRNHIRSIVSKCAKCRNLLCLVEGLLEPKPSP